MCPKSVSVAGMRVTSPTTPQNKGLPARSPRHRRAPLLLSLTHVVHNDDYACTRLHKARVNTGLTSGLANTGHAQVRISNSYIVFSSIEANIEQSKTCTLVKPNTNTLSIHSYVY